MSKPVSRGDIMFATLWICLSIFVGACLIAYTITEATSYV